jgi:hypothetical protein
MYIYVEYVMYPRGKINAIYNYISYYVYIGILSNKQNKKQIMHILISLMTSMEASIAFIKGSFRCNIMYNKMFNGWSCNVATHGQLKLHSIPYYAFIPF